MLALVLSVNAFSPARELSAPVTLATFDAASPLKWQNMNDPVMGGQSHSSFTVAGGQLSFGGLCAIVPFLKAPGFCKVGTVSPLFK